MVDVKKRNAVIVAIALIVLAIVVGIAVYAGSTAKAGRSLQTTDTVLMVSPVDFDYNEETAVNNAFQSQRAPSAHCTPFIPYSSL